MEPRNKLNKTQNNPQAHNNKFTYGNGWYILLTRLTKSNS